ncbi:MAG: V-type ATP synthase subunit A, partial [Oscillospiraceae bacterium]|nr:V-type ATP synthase subunit A [Oscillospiraceae bacterium]
VKLIGFDVLPDDQKLTIEIARVIRLGFLQQNAYHKDDTYVPLEKQFKMMETILLLQKESKNAISKNIAISTIAETGLFEKVIKIKYNISNDNLSAFDELNSEIKNTIFSLYRA